MNSIERCTRDIRFFNGLRMSVGKGRDYCSTDATSEVFIGYEWEDGTVTALCPSMLDIRGFDEHWAPNSVIGIYVQDSELKTLEYLLLQVTADDARRAATFNSCRK